MGRDPWQTPGLAWKAGDFTGIGPASPAGAAEAASRSRRPGDVPKGSRLPPRLRGLVDVAEVAVVQERDRLRDRLGREQQATVAGRNHHVVGQLRAAGFGDRYAAVVVTL